MQRLVIMCFVLAACSDAPASPDAALPPCPVGDPSQPAQLEIVHFGSDLAPVTTVAGASVPLVAPPQGGWVLVLGARVTNLDACHATITTSLHEPCGNTVLVVDRRPTRLDATGDGWAAAPVGYASNLPVCPIAGAARNLHDEPYVVQVEIEDTTGQHASASLTVTPVCPEQDPGGLCACQCDHNYELGQCPAVGPPADPPSCDAGI